MSALVGERKARVTQSLGYFLNVCFSDDKKIYIICLTAIQSQVVSGNRLYCGAVDFVDLA